MDVRNDEPIDSVVNDLFWFSFQASVIAKLVGGKDSKDHLSVGVSGSWGSGKTSLLNMVKELLDYKPRAKRFNELSQYRMSRKYHLQRNKEIIDNEYEQLLSFLKAIHKNCSNDIPSIIDETKVIWFDPWFFGSQETVIKAFFYRIAKELMDEDRELAKLFLKLAVVMSSNLEFPDLTHFPVVSDGLKLFKFGSSLLSRMSGDDGSVQDFSDLKKKICERLKKQEYSYIDDDDEKIDKRRKRIVIIIDDLDRLQKDESLTMLKVIRLVTELGVNFVIGYDEETLSTTIDKNCGGHGREYIRKMINAPVSISAISDGDYLKYFDKHLHPKIPLSELCKIYINRFDAVDKYLNQENHKQERVDYNVFNLPPSLAILIKTLFLLPREIINLSNIFNIYIHTLNTDVDELDFLILCVIRIKFPTLFNLLHDKLWPFRIDQNKNEIEYIKEDEKKVYEKTTKHDLSSDDVIEKSVKRSLYDNYYNLFVDATSEGLFSSIVYYLLFNKADNALKKASNWRYYFCFLQKSYEDNVKSLENLYNSPIGVSNDINGFDTKPKK